MSPVPGAPGAALPSAHSRFLLPVEQPLLVLRQHWVLLLRPVAEALTAFVVAGLLLSAGSDGPVATAIGAALLAVLTHAALLVARWDNERVVVTDRRLLLTSGVLSAKAAVMPLSAITDLTFLRSPAGLLLQYGELVLESAGQQQAFERVRYLPHPDDAYRVVAQALLGLEDRRRQTRERLRDDLDDRGDRHRDDAPGDPPTSALPTVR